MQYKDCAAQRPPADRTGADASFSAQQLLDANINPQTGLATDYLNRFYEAIMLLELLPSCPECRDDVLAWRPLGYCEHFAASSFSGRDLAIAAYAAADPALRANLDDLIVAMTALIEDIRAALQTDPAAEPAGEMAGRTAAQLRPLAARAAALINGESEAPQAVVDGLMTT